MPYMDQLAKEGEMILAPYYEGTLRLADFFVPHNEHRIAPTLALNLALAAAGGKWDARVQCLANALLHGALAAAMVGFFWRHFSRRWALSAAWLLAVLCALGLDWQNTLGGFQSQFYFLAGFSLAAIYGLLAVRGPLSVRWWVGLSCALLAVVSMGSGFLCAAPVALAVGLRCAANRRISMADGTTLLASAVFLGAGWRLRAPAPWHAVLHARNAGDFLAYFAHCLSWPRPEWPWLGALVWLPWAILAVRAVWRPGPRYDERSEVLLACGLWVLLQAAAVAYARGAGGGYPASRYGAVFSIGVAANLAVFPLLGGAAHGRPRAGFAVLWIALVLGAGAAAASPIWRLELPAAAARYRECEANVRGYVLTGDVRFLEKGEQPLPYRDWLRRILDRPAIRAHLPESVGGPARMSALSETARLLCRQGPAIFGAGVVLLLAATALETRR